MSSLGACSSTHFGFQINWRPRTEEVWCTARPELRSVRIKHGKDQFLAFTSDGINFVMRDEEVVDCINKCEGAKEGAARLVDQVRSSKIAGSCRFESGNALA